MGVLACDRKGCENIMCDHFSFKYGYICNECFYELKSKPWISIRNFMSTQKEVSYKEHSDSWEDYINSIFEMR